MSCTRCRRGTPTPTSSTRPARPPRWRRGGCASRIVGGLLTPERTRELLPRMIEAAGDIPWEFHGHCNNGLGPLNALEAVKAGVTYVHTAVPPLANGNSQPSVFTIAENLRALGYGTDLNEEVLHGVQEHFERVAE